MQTHRKIDDAEIQTMRLAFQKNGICRINDFFLPEHAEELRTFLLERKLWDIIHHRYTHDRVSTRVVTSDKNLTGDEISKLRDSVISSSNDDFQYFYKSYDLIEARIKKKETNICTGLFLDTISSNSVFSIVREISNDLTFNRVNAHACRYEKFDFLKEHSDESLQEKRRVAYVYGLSKNWKADYGGLTHFFRDKHDYVAETIVPSFNTLLLFSVPVLHSVSMVTPFALEPRVSITGWYSEY